MSTDFSRFSIIDEYTLEELRREYQSSAPKDRIALVAGLYQSGIIPPYDIARLAVEDQHVEVRQWLARHARHLDYREAIDDDPANGFRYPDRDLVEHVRRDTDAFVRACLFENPDIFANLSYEQWCELFVQSSHIEKLALVRNPNMQGVHKLLEAIFDPDDGQFKLTLSEREQLVNALLLSRQALSENHRKGSSVFAQPWDARLFSRLWRLINKWPKDARIKRNIYLYIGTTIKTKAGIYRQCKQPTLRADILRNVEPDDSDTLELGMKDPDDLCRFLAHSKARNFSTARFDILIKKDDVHALTGLAENASLSLSQLEQIKERLFALGAHEEARWASETIDRLRRTQLPENPEAIFKYDVYSEITPEAKLNFIGQSVLRLQRDLDYLTDLLKEHTNPPIK